MFGFPAPRSVTRSGRTGGQQLTSKAYTRRAGPPKPPNGPPRLGGPEPVEVA